MTAKLLLPTLAIEEVTGIAVTIPTGATVDYECSNVVVGVADLQWNGQNYFANIEDVIEASVATDASAHAPSAWVN
jgi:hypothetical protein